MCSEQIGVKLTFWIGCAPSRGTLREVIATLAFARDEADGEYEALERNDTQAFKRWSRHSGPARGRTMVFETQR